MRMKKRLKREYGMAMLTTVLWGTISPVGKLVLGEIPEMEMLFITASISALFLGLITVLTGHGRAMRSFRAKDFAILAALGFLGTFLYNLFYYYGIAELTSQEATIINYLWPMMVVLFSWPVLHEKLTARSVAALVISFVGIAIMVTKLDLDSLKGSNFAGILACMGAAVSYGLFSAINKKYHYDQYVAMTVYNLVMAICAGVLLLLHPELVSVSSGKMLAGLLWIGLAADGVAYLLWCQALILGDTSRISNIAYMTPFLSILFAKLLLDEPMSIFSFIGLGFILIGIFIQFHGAGAKKQAQV